jgi:hypothetical protein
VLIETTERMYPDRATQFKIDVQLEKFIYYNSN